MIASAIEYQRAQDELRDRQDRVDRLQQGYPIGDQCFTKAGIRNMIARLHEEMAMYEGSEEVRHADTK